MSDIYVDRANDKYVVTYKKPLFGPVVKEFPSHSQALEFAKSKSPDFVDRVPEKKIESIDLLFKRQPARQAAPPQQTAVKSKISNQKPSHISYPFKLAWEKKFETVFKNAEIFLAPPFLIDNVYKPGDTLILKSQVLAEVHATLSKDGFCSTGAFTYSHSKLPSTTKIGRFCSLAGGIKVMGPSHPMDRVTTSTVTYGKYFSGLIQRDYDSTFKPLSYQAAAQPVTIGNDVWIGEMVLIAGGVTIGDGAVIGARSIVTRDVPPYSVVAGSPAKIRKMRFSDEIIKRFLEIKWWNYNFGNLPASWDEPEKFLADFDRSLSRHVLDIFDPKTIDVGLELYWFARNNPD